MQEQWMTGDPIDLVKIVISILESSDLPRDECFAYMSKQAYKFMQTGESKLILRGTYRENGCNIKWRGER